MCWFSAKHSDDCLFMITSDVTPVDRYSEAECTPCVFMIKFSAKHLMWWIFRGIFNVSNTISIASASSRIHTLHGYHLLETTISIYVKVCRNCNPVLPSFTINRDAKWVPPVQQELLILPQYLHSPPHNITPTSRHGVLLLNL